MNEGILIFLIGTMWICIWRLLLIEKKTAETHMFLTSIQAHLNEDRLQGISKQKLDEAKPAGANRRPRTDEEKLKASIRRKEWWAKKRASEAKGQTLEAQVNDKAAN